MFDTEMRRLKRGGMEAGGSQRTLVQGYSGPRKICKTPSESPPAPQGRGGDPAPTPHEGHEAGALWYHLKHPPPSKAGSGISLPVLENLRSIPKLQQSRQLPEHGVGDGHKINSLSYFLPIPKASQLGYRRLTVHGYPQDKEEASGLSGRGWGTPHPQFLAEKEKENPRDRQSPQEGRRAKGTGAGTETQPSRAASTSMLCSSAPHCLHHGWPFQFSGALGPLGGQWSHARILGTRPLWPGSTLPQQGAASSPSNGTVTHGHRHSVSLARGGQSWQGRRRCGSHRPR